MYGYGYQYSAIISGGGNPSDAMETILYRYKGTIGGKRIDQTLLSNQEILFDNSSQCARVIMEYSIRENLT